MLENNVHPFSFRRTESKCTMQYPITLLTCSVLTHILWWQILMEDLQPYYPGILTILATFQPCETVYHGLRHTLTLLTCSQCLWNISELCYYLDILYLQPFQTVYNIGCNPCELTHDLISAELSACNSTIRASCTFSLSKLFTILTVTPADLNMWSVKCWTPCLQLYYPDILYLQPFQTVYNIGCNTCLVTHDLNSRPATPLSKHPIHLQPF